MRIDRPSSSTSTDTHAAGWIVSLILHGTLALGVFLFLQQIKLAPQPTLFKWNVAMVAPAPQTTAASTPTTQRSAPPTPAAEPTAKPVSTAVQSVIQPMKPLAPIVDPRMSEAPRPIAEQIPHPVAEQTPIPRTTETMEHKSSQADPAPHASALSTPPQPASSAPAESALSAHDEPVASLKDPLPPQQAATPTGPQVADLGPADQTKPIKADYGWLSELMAQWIGELDKRYPAMLRTEGITGRVTLTALLHQDGALSDVRVVKSSGNALLDQVAVEDIRNGPPVRLSRPLERPHMPVKFSIVYDLKTAR
jgi:protein TonB